MSYKKFMNEGKEPKEFVKRAAHITASMSKGTGKVVEGVGKIGAGVLKCAAEGLDFVFSVATLPLRAALNVLWYNAQEGKHLGTRVACGLASAVVGLPTLGIMLPGAIVYAVLKKSETFVKRVAGGVALPFDQLGDAILLEGDPKGYFDKMHELDEKHEQEQIREMEEIFG